MSQKGLSFDVARLLRIGTPDSTPITEAADGEILLRVSEGIHFIGLCDSAIGRELLHRQDWCEKYEWCRQLLPSGLYRLRVPVPGSYNKTFNEQQLLLAKGEQVAPVTAVALALLCVQNAGHADPLNSDWVRCAETTTTGRIGLYWLGGRLGVSSPRDGDRDYVWLASVRTS